MVGGDPPAEYLVYLLVVLIAHLVVRAFDNHNGPDVGWYGHIIGKRDFGLSKGGNCPLFIQNPLSI